MFKKTAQKKVILTQTNTVHTLLQFIFSQGSHVQGALYQFASCRYQPILGRILQQKAEFCLSPTLNSNSIKILLHVSATCYGHCQDFPEVLYHSIKVRPNLKTKCYYICHAKYRMSNAVCVKPGLTLFYSDTRFLERLASGYSQQSKHVVKFL